MSGIQRLDLSAIWSSAIGFFCLTSARPAGLPVLWCFVGMGNSGKLSKSGKKKQKNWEVESSLHSLESENSMLSYTFPHKAMVWDELLHPQDPKWFPSGSWISRRCHCWWTNRPRNLLVFFSGCKKCVQNVLKMRHVLHPFESYVHQWGEAPPLDPHHDSYPPFPRPFQRPWPHPLPRLSGWKCVVGDWLVLFQWRLTNKTAGLNQKKWGFTDIHPHLYLVLSCYTVEATICDADWSKNDRFEKPSLWWKYHEDIIGMWWLMGFN